MEAIRRKFFDWSIHGFPAGAVRGIEVRLHPTLPVVWLWFILSDMASMRPSYGLVAALSGIVILSVSVLLHELGHALAARAIGGDCDRILLWPLGGLAFTSGGNNSPFHEFFIVVMGPLVSLGLALVGTLVAAIFTWIDPVPTSFLMWSLETFWIAFRDLNWALFIFNMVVPLFPMDAARLLRSGLSMRFEPGRITYNICLLGFFAAGVLVCLFFVEFTSLSASGSSFAIMLPLVAMFGIQGCILEMRRIQYEDVYTLPDWTWPRWDQLTPRLYQAMTTAQRRSRAAVSARKPKGPAKIVELYSEIESLEVELRKAVEAEDFVRAAQLRDEIKSLDPVGPRKH